ncbi:MAG: TetR/AcrR family transcriptional regulator [Lachnospiraceae bacterium]|nr:TetR/AcrR family transcriptional regulator [Lachnospiraceae bacterium]
MPRDKSLTHAKVLDAAKRIFLEKGYEQASIREIAAAAGITSAGLYRHCSDKEDLFEQVVEPAIKALQEWVTQHIRQSYERMENREYQGIGSQSEIEMIRKVALPYREEFRLLLLKSGGTKHEHFLQDMVETHETKMWEGLRNIAAYGYQVKEVSREELHILISAYITALFEPIIRDYPEEKVEHYLDTVEAFFMPGWHELLGV